MTAHCPKLRRSLAAGSAALAAALIAGCSSPAFEVGVSLSPELRTLYGIVPTVEADFAGITPSEIERVRSVSVDEWFAPGNPLRASLSPKTLRFSEDRPLAQSISEDDPVWELWEKRGVTDLAVFVNLPMTPSAKGGDPRKLIEHIRAEGWMEREGGEIWIEIGPGGAVKLAGPPAEKPEQKEQTK